MKRNFKLLSLIIPIIILLTACGNSDIKDNFCGIHINFQYCKCAFHNEYCSNINMSKSEAKEHVYQQYDKWLNEEENDDEEYGVIEKDGKLYINSEPGKVLKIKKTDLPDWARGQLVVIGATITTAGVPDSVVSGDNNVLLNGLPVACINDSTAQGGVITEGSDKIFINGKKAAYIGAFASSPMVGGGGVPYVGGPITANPQ